MKNDFMQGKRMLFGINGYKKKINSIFFCKIRINPILKQFFLFKVNKFSADFKQKLTKVLYETIIESTLKSTKDNTADN